MPSPCKERQGHRRSSAWAGHVNDGERAFVSSLDECRGRIPTQIRNWIAELHRLCELVVSLILPGDSQPRRGLLFVLQLTRAQCLRTSSVLLTLIVNRSQRMQVISTSSNILKALIFGSGEIVSGSSCHVSAWI